MSAVRFIAWGMIDLEEKTHRERLELFAQVKREIRKPPYRLTLKKAGIRPTPGNIYWVGGDHDAAPAAAYRYSLSKSVHKGTRRRPRQMLEGHLKQCCEAALAEMENIERLPRFTQRGNQK